MRCFGKVLPALGLSLMPAVLAAEVDVYVNCGFATECYEDEGCQEANFAATLVGVAVSDDAIAAPVKATWRSDGGDVAMEGVLSNGAYLLDGGAGLGRHFLTVNAEGAARYTVHFASGPAVVSYLGRCEAGQ